jgi:hypothetical protein
MAVVTAVLMSCENRLTWMARGGKECNGLQILI